VKEEGGLARVAVNTASILEVNSVCNHLTTVTSDPNKDNGMSRTNPLYDKKTGHQRRMSRLKSVISLTNDDILLLDAENGSIVAEALKLLAISGSSMFRW
jgi:hypothetical protein